MLLLAGTTRQGGGAIDRPVWRMRQLETSQSLEFRVVEHEERRKRGMCSSSRLWAACACGRFSPFLPSFLPFQPRNSTARAIVRMIPQKLRSSVQRPIDSQATRLLGCSLPPLRAAARIARRSSSNSINAQRAAQAQTTPAPAAHSQTTTSTTTTTTTHTHTGSNHCLVLPSSCR